jgi:hypothetical protein
MLCVIYAIEKDRDKVKHHWDRAEKRRKAIPSQVRQELDWKARGLAETMIGKLDPSMLSHQECHNCHKLAADPKICSACKFAVYCSKECQMVAWKNGHKKECMAAKGNRKTNTKERKQAEQKYDAVAKLPPVDATLEPKKLWASANKLAQKASKAQDAVFHFAVALFMDFSLDAQDMKLAKKAVEACPSDDTVALALGMLTHRGQSNGPLEHCERQREMAFSLDRESPLESYPCGVESLEQVDRFEFGLAMNVLFQARIMGRCFAVTSAEQANSQMHKDAFDDITSLISSAKRYLDPRRWLTYQYELGYSHLDIGAALEAKLWLDTFLKTLDTVKQKNGSLNRHWTGYLNNAQQKLAMIPIIERAKKSGKLS